MVNEGLRQVLEQQVMLLAARPHKTSAKTFWGSPSPPNGQRDHRHQYAGAVGSQATSGVTASMEGSQSYVMTDGQSASLSWCH
jgi:hypothetical protein